MADYLSSNKRIDYLVYINGVRVPCTSVTCSGNDTNSGNPLIFVVSIPMHPILASLGANDKLQVAVFYLDSWKYRDNPTWCLLVEGYTKSFDIGLGNSTRQMSITCQSNETILEKLFLEFLGGGDISTSRVGKPDRVIPNEITFKGKFPGQLFTSKLEGKDQIKAPYELIQNIILATTGFIKDKDTIKGATTQEISAEIDKLTALYELNYKNKLEEYKDNKQARDDFLKFEESKLISLASKSGISIEGSNFLDKQKKYIKVSVETLLKDRSVNSRTPASSGFFSRFFNLTKMSRKIVASPVLEGLILRDSSKSKPSMPSGVFPMLRTRMGSRYLKAIATQTGYKFGENGSAYSLIHNLFTIFNYSLTRVISPPAYKVDDRGLPSGKFESGGSSNAIAELITKPITMFSLPPACNMVFPPIRKSIQYSRFTDVPTRLYYNGTSQGRKLNLEQKLGTGYAALDSKVGFPAAIARHAIDSAKTSRSELEVLVFPEEYYSGPVTVYKELDPMLFEIDKMEKAGRLKDDISVANNVDYVDMGGIPSQDAAYLREAFIKSDSKGQNNYDLYLKQAQNEYMKLRTQNSMAQVTLAFNPYIVNGYSCIVCDSEEVGLHIIGTVVSVSHSINQGEASTIVSLSNCRPLIDMIKQCYLDGAKYEVSPQEPITEVRAVLQKMEAANFYFANLLYRDSDYNPSSSPEVDKIYTELSEINNSIFKKEQELANETTKKTQNANTVQAIKASIAKLQDSYQQTYSKLQTASKTSTGSEEFKAVADYRDLFSIEDMRTSTILDIDVGSLLSSSTKIDSYKTAEALTYSRLVPKAGSEDFFTDYGLAMDYCSRPVCTLEQYIDFYANTPATYGGIEPGGRGRGVRIGKTYLDNEEGYAPSYIVIREFVGGPGVEPGSKVSTDQFNKSQATTEASTVTNTSSVRLNYITEGPNHSAIKKVFANITGTAKVSDLPDSAQDWQDLLITYVNLINLGDSTNGKQSI